MSNIPRNEYPRPQLVRDNWINLNGTWEFEQDPGCSGPQRGVFNQEKLAQTILVPFCPESALSGLAHTDFMNGVWYARTVTLDPPAGKRLLLHIGAADYETTVWVNGQEMGRHVGGYTSFQMDITEAVKAGENRIAIYCEDHTRDEYQPSGKQCNLWGSYSCLYTRTTGIWQTVWLEYVSDVYVTGVKMFPNVEDPSVTMELKFSGCLYGQTASARVTYEGREMGTAQIRTSGRQACITVPLAEKHLWEVGHGRLYDVEITAGDDRLQSYFGLRSVAIDGKKILINGKPVFQRLILDQGFYPDGIYTAPSDEALQQDIALSQRMGFNGARLHQKVFEERFLYHADRMGYICWGEFPSWGVNMITKGVALQVILPQWLEELERDFSHPCIVCWCPLNETHPDRCREVHSGLYYATKAVDSTRPCIDTSGYTHVITDIWDIHDYDQNVESYRRKYGLSAFREHPFVNHPDREPFNSKLPYINGEFGGIHWNPRSDGGWGYGDSPKTIEEFYERYTGLTKALLDNEDIAGFCYTQLTDVEQEHNGLYFYDRTEKFDAERIRAVTSGPAAIEASQASADAVKQ